MLDIALYIINRFPKDVSLDTLTAEDLERVIFAGKIFETSTVKDIMELSGSKRGHEDLQVVEKTTPIETLMEMFYRGIHRVIVVEHEPQIPISLLSQSDLLMVLAQCLPFLEEYSNSLHSPLEK